MRMEHHIKKVHNLDSGTYYISVTTKKLQMHIESDQMELAHTCEICGQTFKTKDTQRSFECW